MSWEEVLALLKGYADAKLAGVFDAYDSTSGYTKGEYVIYNNSIYEANQDIASPAGDFDPTKWTATNFSEVAEGKADKPVIATNVAASTWASDSTYSAYGFIYACSISLSGVTADDFAEVTFGMDDVLSENYAPFAVTSSGTVTIYSKVNDSITIPTIVVTKK